MADGAAGFKRGVSDPALLRIPLCSTTFPLRGFHTLGLTFPGNSSLFADTMLRSYNPGKAVTSPVWAVPRSLATTYGITIVFSSSGYLDVSVPPVRLLSDSIPSV